MHEQQELFVKEANTLPKWGCFGLGYGVHAVSCVFYGPNVRRKRHSEQIKFLTDLISKKVSLHQAQAVQAAGHGAFARHESDHQPAFRAGRQGGGNGKVARVDVGPRPLVERHCGDKDTIDLDVEGAGNIVAIFGQWGAIQLLLALVLVTLLLRYRGLTPFIALALAVEPLLRMLAGALKPIETLGTAPGAALNEYMGVIMLFVLWLSLCPVRSRA